MIHEFERYHGAVLRELIVKVGKSTEIRVVDDAGRVNSFVVNDSLILYIKHSSKRLSPWQFTFTSDNLAEINRLSQHNLPIWLIFVCGQDGMLAISYEEFQFINPVDATTTSFVRVDRDRNTMYRVNGTQTKLRSPKPRGISSIITALLEMKVRFNT